MTENTSAYEEGWMLVSDDGYITDLGEGSPSENILAGEIEVVSLEGKILMPGFVSGHSHLWQSAFRGIAPDGELWPWLDAIHRTYGSDFATGDMKAFTAHGAWDQLCHGVTTTYNHTHWLDHDYAIFVEQLDGEMDVPQRFVFSSCVDLAEEPSVWKQRFVDLMAESKQVPTKNFLSLALNLRPYGPPSVAAAQVELAEALDINYQLHYLEQSGRQEMDRSAWPGYREAGVPSGRATFAHFIHVDDTILSESAEAGAGMIWNPLSNGRLGSGLPDISTYLESGLKVGMGVDGQASADISDPFENLRMGLYALRMRDENSDGLQPIDILRLHTIQTAKTLGVDAFVGSLEEGKFADFLVVDPQSPITGPIWDIPAHLVFSCSSANIESVYVGGAKVVSSGEPVDFDLLPLAKEVEERISEMRKRHASTQAE
ncbi:amidohydrolase family protein [Pelagicoccus albus]|uniref:Amidohydrolase family protein n=1 Tax=Pelagicoccus albus TaxID=415222 RepID=A0A7X1B786_9BACT|nr:amidohydrolase family protein [Pelagicoccus albus]MBC2606699.1 amidohydrolase family protein [Pelagicoccus albus]